MLPYCVCVCIAESNARSPLRQKGGHLSWVVLLHLVIETRQSRSVIIAAIVCVCLLKFTELVSSRNEQRIHPVIFLFILKYIHLHNLDLYTRLLLHLSCPATTSPPLTVCVVWVW